MEQYDKNENTDERGLEKYSHFVLKMDTMLVMENASIHKIDIVKDKIRIQSKDKYDSWWSYEISSSSRGIHLHATQGWVEEEGY